MPKGPNSDNVNDNDTDDVTDDATDDVTDDATDDTTDDDASDGDQNGDQGGTPQDQGGKPQSKTRQPNNQQPSDDPNAGLKKALQAERASARQLDRDLKELQRKHATAEERQLME